MSINLRERSASALEFGFGTHLTSHSAKPIRRLLLSPPPPVEYVPKPEIWSRDHVVPDKAHKFRAYRMVAGVGAGLPALRWGPRKYRTRRGDRPVALSQSFSISRVCAKTSS